MIGSYFVYILASRYKGTLYVGVTRDLNRRVGEHKSGFVPGFTREYKIHRLVYYEEYASILEARARERVLMIGKAEARAAGQVIKDDGNAAQHIADFLQRYQLL